MKFFEVDAFVIMVNDFGCRASETIFGSHFPALELCYTYNLHTHEMSSGRK